MEDKFSSVVRENNTAQHNGGLIATKNIFEGKNMSKIHKDNISEKVKRYEKTLKYT